FVKSRFLTQNAMHPKHSVSTPWEHGRRIGELHHLGLKASPARSQASVGASAHSNSQISRRLSYCLLVGTIVFVAASNCGTRVAAEPDFQTIAQPGMLKSEFIFATGKVAFAQCHASTIAETRGRLVAAWFGGSGEGHHDVGIWLSRNENGQWSPP